MAVYTQPKKQRVPLWSMQKKPDGHSRSSLHVGLHHPSAEHLPPVQHDPAAPPHCASVEQVDPYVVPPDVATGRCPGVDVAVPDEPLSSSLPQAMIEDATQPMTRAREKKTLLKGTSRR